MKIRGITKSLLFTAIAAFFVLMVNASAWGQTTIVNYDFASAVAGTPCTASPLTTASGVTSTFTTGGAGGGTCTPPAGAAASSPPAFVANASNQAVSLSNFATGSSNFFQFQLSGVSSFQNYMLFFQNQASGTGADNIDVQYSTDGTNFTTFQTFVPSTSLATSGRVVDLSSVAAIENQPTVYFRILGRRVAPAGGTLGTFRIDNFQVQAMGPTAASGTIGGRIVSSSGRGIRNVRIMLTGGSLSEPMYATSTSFGYYQFPQVPVGETYVLQVFSKNYIFNSSSMVINLTEDLTEANFTGQPRGLGLTGK